MTQSKRSAWQMKTAPHICRGIELALGSLAAVPASRSLFALERDGLG